MKHKLLVLSLLPVALAACSTGDKEAKPLCPQTVIVRELESIKDYGSEQPSEDALVASAKMNHVDGTCDYLEDGVDINFTLKISAEKKQRLGGKRAGFPFFISIIDPENKILSKELMTSNFVFDEDNNTAEKSEDLHVFIPLDKLSDGENYQVLLGFQLTEDQITAVRKADESLGR